MLVLRHSAAWPYLVLVTSERKVQLTLIPSTALLFNLEEPSGFGALEQAALARQRQRGSNQHCRCRRRYWLKIMIAYEDKKGKSRAALEAGA